MGEWTELTFTARLKHDTPQEVISTLLKMVDDKYKLLSNEYPYKSENIRNVFHGGDSDYPFNQKPIMKYLDNSKCWILNTRASIRNHDHQIEQFLAWIKLYIDEGGCGHSGIYAYVIHEVDYLPKIYCIIYDKDESNSLVIDAIETDDY